MSSMQSRSSGFDADVPMQNNDQGMAMSGEQFEAGLDPLANAGERKKLNAGSLVLVVVVIVAGLGVWSMRAMTRVGASTVRNSDVESTIDDFLGTLKTPGTAKSGGTSAILAPTDTVLSVLTETYTQRQVPLTDVQRNPFIWEGDGEHASAPTDDPTKGQAKRLADRKAQVENAANRLQLKSIIMSKVPIANISGKIVRVDDEIRGDSDNIVFRVVSIAADSVTLVCDDPELDLSVAITLTVKR